jgi:hypothetical protein
MNQDIIAETDIWADDNGKVVRGDPPDAGIKLAAKGSVINPKIAKRYNLDGGSKAKTAPAPPAVGDKKGATLTTSSIKKPAK